MTRSAATIEAAKAGNIKSWNRARTLQRLAGGHNDIGFCRAFLSKYKDDYTALLENPNIDGRTAGVKDMLFKLTAFNRVIPRILSGNENPARPSKGDPSRPVRAGSPQRTKTPHPHGNSTLAQTPAAVCTDLRQIQLKHGVTIDQLQYALKVLKDITETLSNIDGFLQHP